jgi:hypothetical protein
MSRFVLALKFRIAAPILKGLQGEDGRGAGLAGIEREWFNVEWPNMENGRFFPDPARSASASAASRRSAGASSAKLAAPSFSFWRAITSALARRAARSREGSFSFSAFKAAPSGAKRIH